ncbi:DUF4010 domain-containing protein [Hydrogenophaga sp. PAMC20947]|uniref:MgtC/SapB family protein n=1 Tax=Hydrogenophaga sp. PAMC20947 TaxID=2565558 RepID=UPI00109E31A2|nr:DUF4010 domain-containing protein [Hydrogenophaga sp. PAMC20947]QCB48072.1 DUF4010 domain-containing protein [Hydrogenophaga sp. PAMC20947]
MLNPVSALSPVPFSLQGALAVLVTALGCGLLIGIERERRKGIGPGRALAGLRSFSITCVTGAVAALTPFPGLVVTGAVMVVALSVVAHLRNRSDDPGTTTEIALFLTYLIGVLCVWSLPLAAALAVGLTALLAGREPLHRFAHHWLRQGEVRDGIILAALVLMALPLVPNRPFWGPVLNPYVIVQLLALLLAVQSLAHLCRRLLRAREAVAFSALASGFVSSTATIATLGLAAREGRSSPRLMAGGGLMSCVSTQAQLLLVALAVQPAWLSVLWLPALMGGLMAAGWGWWLVRGAPPEPSDGVVSSPGVKGLPGAGDDRMFSLWGAAAVAALLAGIQVVVHAFDLWLGQAGLLVGTLLASIADLHAALAAVFASSGPVLSDGSVWPVMLALSVHAGSKSLTAGLVGGWAYLRWLAPGLWLHTALAVGLLYGLR